MKRYHHFLVVVLALVLLMLSVTSTFTAETIYTQDGFYYARSSATTADLYGRESTDSDLVIPKKFSEYYVTNIVDSAFYGDQNIATLDLATATLLERIGYYAFSDCPNLSGTVVFGGRINQLGASCFQNCTSLESIWMKNSYVTDIPAQCFYNCSTLSSVTLPDKLKSIQKFAFANCTSLTEITIPKSVTSINSTAFSGDDDLTIYCYYDSYAAQFAEDNGIPYVILDPPAPTEPTEEPTEAPTDVPTQEPTEAPTDEPTQEPTEAPTESVRYVLGDVDNNGLVETIDSTWIQRYNVMIDLPEGLSIPHGDVDGDGDVSLIDSTYILRYCTQMEVPYPIGEWVEES